MNFADSADADMSHILNVIEHVMNIALPYFTVSATLCLHGFPTIISVKETNPASPRGKKLAPYLFPIMETIRLHVFRCMHSFFFAMLICVGCIFLHLHRLRDGMLHRRKQLHPRTRIQTLVHICFLGKERMGYVFGDALLLSNALQMLV